MYKVAIKIRHPLTPNPHQPKKIMRAEKQTPVSSGELKAEIMRGNLVHHVVLSTSMILEIRNDGISICNPKNTDNAYFVPNDKLNRIEPIPLSPEILEKCGFKKTVTKMRIVDYIDYRQGNFVLSVIDKGVEVEYCALNIEDRTYIGILNYLHQLQNLYNSLTGSHLKVEL